MSKLRRPVRQVATGMAAVVGLALWRRALIWRGRQQGRPVRLSRRARKRQRARARAATRWALANVETIRRFVDTSESASTQLSAWDNARRTADSFLSAADVVQDRLAAERSGPWSSTRAALQTKLADLRADAAPQLHAADTAEAELSRLQISLRQQEKQLRTDAPADIAAVATALVAAHERARQPMAGTVDELRARHRLDELTELREGLEAKLGNLSRGRS